MNVRVSPLLAGKSVGNPPSWFAEEPDDAVEGASGSQAQGGPRRVAPHRQQHPLQYGLRLPGEPAGTADALRVMCLSQPRSSYQLIVNLFRCCWATHQLRLLIL